MDRIIFSCDIGMSNHHWLPLCFLPLCFTFQCVLLSPRAQMVKNRPMVQETRVRSLGLKDLEKGMAIHSIILTHLAKRIPRTKEPGGLQSTVVSQRVGHNWVTNTYFHMQLSNSFPLNVSSSCFDFHNDFFFFILVCGVKKSSKLILLNKWFVQNFLLRKDSHEDTYYRSKNYANCFCTWRKIQSQEKMAGLPS